jgi:hypothetical protein
MRMASRKAFSPAAASPEAVDEDAAAHEDLDLAEGIGQGFARIEDGLGLQVAFARALRIAGGLEHGAEPCEELRVGERFGQSVTRVRKCDGALQVQDRVLGLVRGIRETAELLEGTGRFLHVQAHFEALGGPRRCRRRSSP